VATDKFAFVLVFWLVYVANGNVAHYTMLVSIFDHENTGVIQLLEFPLCKY